VDFTIAPSLAVPAALAHAELAMSDVSLRLRRTIWTGR